MNLIEIPVGTLQPWPELNPRRAFREEELAELAASIREKGVLEPLLVHQANGDGPWIVAGERRWRAAQLADRATVPCLVREFSESEALEIALIENLQRSDLTPIEEARGLQRYLEKTGVSQRELAEKIGRSQPYIANRIRLLELPAAVLDLIEGGAIEMTWARDCLLPFTGITIEKVREQFFAGLAKELHRAELDEEGFWELVTETYAALGRSLSPHDWGTGHRPVAELDHSSCSCGAPALERRGYGRPVQYCVDEDWWNAANSKAQERTSAKEKREAARAVKQAQALGKKEVYTEDELQKKLGWQGFERLTHEGGKLRSYGPLIDPSTLPPDSIVRGKPPREPDTEIYCIDMEALKKARAAASRERNAILREKREERAKEWVVGARKRKVTAKTLRFLMGERPMSEEIANVAKEIGLAIDVRCARTDDLKKLSDVDIELLAKVLELRKERGQASWQDPLEGRVEGQLRSKYSKRLKALLEAAPSPNGKPAKKGKKGKQSGAAVEGGEPESGTDRHPEAAPADSTEEGPYAVRKKGSGQTAVYQVYHQETGNVRGTRSRERDAVAAAAKWNAEAPAGEPAPA